VPSSCRLFLPLFPPRMWSPDHFYLTLINFPLLARSNLSPLSIFVLGRIPVIFDPFPPQDWRYFSIFEYRHHPFLPGPGEECTSSDPPCTSNAPFLGLLLFSPLPKHFWFFPPLVHPYHTKAPHFGSKDSHKTFLSFF